MIKYLLYPITWLFTIIVYMRNALYDCNILPRINSKLPVISVGNIQVGGTGKTPLVVSLAKKLIENNIKPLIITRGYKRNTTHQIIFNNLEQYSAQEVGDEPYYMKQVLESVPMIIDYNKKKAVKIANQMDNIDCIILDDGFQSRYINKSLDIVLIDPYIDKQLITLMPAGLLREPLSSLKRADFVYTKGKDHLAFNYQLHKYQNNNKEIVENIIPSESFVAFCGIGNPKSFILELENNNITIDKKIIFENHANYNAKKYQQLKNTNPNNLSFITTYKDFVKLNTEFKNTYTIYVLEMNLVLNDNRLLDKIKALISEN